jgi:predicted acylesterase/phospholipase RssA
MTDIPHSSATEPSAAITRERPASERPATHPSKRPFALALSGGGFRASLYHLGVVRFLRDADLLRHVTHICSISGGSIFAAYLLLHWDDFINGDFDKTAKRFTEFVQSDVRGRIFRHWLVLRGMSFLTGLLLAALVFVAGWPWPYHLVWVAFVAWPLADVFLSRRVTGMLQQYCPSLYQWSQPDPKKYCQWFCRRWLVLRILPGVAGIVIAAVVFVVGWSWPWHLVWVALIVWPLTEWLSANDLTELLEKQYNSLYKGAQLKDLGVAQSSPPNLVLLATCLTNGEPVAFTRDGFVLLQQLGNDNPKNIDTLPVAKAVTASSAFPPVFPPLHLTGSVMRDKSFKTRLLTDGGVYDDLGVDCLKWLKRYCSAPFEWLLISDAEMAFAPDDDSFSGPISRNTRATNILMKRMSDTAYQELQPDNAPDVCRAAIYDVVKAGEGPYATREAVQREINEIRTDLNNFSDYEVHVLVAHGFATARKACSKKSFYKRTEQEKEPWSPVPYVYGKDRAKQGDSLAGSRRIPRRLLANEIYTWAWVLPLLATVVAGMSWYAHKLIADRVAPALSRPAPSDYKIDTVELIKDEVIRDRIFNSNRWLWRVVDHLDKESAANNRSILIEVRLIRINRRKVRPLVPSTLTIDVDHSTFPEAPAYRLVGFCFRVSDHERVLCTSVPIEIHGAKVTITFSPGDPPEDLIFVGYLEVEPPKALPRPDQLPRLFKVQQ